MHNLTFSERERMAYANGQLELAKACGEAAEFEEQNEQLFDQVWELENTDTRKALEECIEQMEQAEKLVDCVLFSNALRIARLTLEKTEVTQ